MTQVRSPSRPLLDMSRLLAHHPAKFDQSLPAAHWLHLPEVMIVMMMMMMMGMIMSSHILPQDVKFQIDDALSQFEAADFTEYSEDLYDLPREFSILGSCLFHKVGSVYYSWWCLCLYPGFPAGLPPAP